MVAKTNEDRLRETPPASGRVFNEAAEVVNVVDLIAAIAQKWETWSGAGSGNAPTGLLVNTIGFDTDGIGTSLLYTYNAANDTWTATTQTFDGFIGL